MNKSISAFLARCTLYYYQYFLQLNLELVALFFLFLVLKKKILFVLSLVAALKQQFNELINGTSQRKRDQKSNLSFLKRPD